MYIVSINKLSNTRARIAVEELTNNAPKAVHYNMYREESEAKRVASYILRNGSNRMATTVDYHKDLHLDLHLPIEENLARVYNKDVRVANLICASDLCSDDHKIERAIKAIKEPYEVILGEVWVSYPTFVELARLVSVEAFKAALELRWMKSIAIWCSNA